MLDSLKLELLNERISILDGIYVKTLVNIISIIIFVLTLKKLGKQSA